MNRIPYDAQNKEEVGQYFKVRQLQFAEKNIYWDRKIYSTKEGFFIEYIDLNDNKKYNSFYVLKQNRNKGYSQLLIKNLGEILTLNDCGIISFLQKHKKEHKVSYGTFDSLEYKLIKDFYGDGKAQRSNVWFMNHIDEGILILNKIKSSKSSREAFCLHPLVQDDPNLSKNFMNLTLNIHAYNLGLSLEYRNIANAYLSKRIISNINEISLSPLKEVNQMLVADKVQNYKDFLLYHKDTHPRKNELNKYFNNWLDKLECRDTFEWYIEHSKQFEKPIQFIET